MAKVENRCQASWTPPCQEKSPAAAKKLETRNSLTNGRPRCFVKGESLFVDALSFFLPVVGRGASILG